MNKKIKGKPSKIERADGLLMYPCVFTNKDLREMLPGKWVEGPSKYRVEDDFKSRNPEIKEEPKNKILELIKNREFKQEDYIDDLKTLVLEQYEELYDENESSPDVPFFINMNEAISYLNESIETFKRIRKKNFDEIDNLDVCDNLDPNEACDNYLINKFPRANLTGDDIEKWKAACWREVLVWDVAKLAARRALGMLQALIIDYGGETKGYDFGPYTQNGVAYKSLQEIADKAMNKDKK